VSPEMPDECCSKNELKPRVFEALTAVSKHLGIPNSNTHFGSYESFGGRSDKRQSPISDYTSKCISEHSKTTRDRRDRPCWHSRIRPLGREEIKVTFRRTRPLAEIGPKTRFLAECSPGVCIPKADMTATGSERRRVLYVDDEDQLLRRRSRPALIRMSVATGDRGTNQIRNIQRRIREGWRS